MQIKSTRWFWAAGIIFFLAFAVSSLLAGDKHPPKDKVALVNGTAITQEAFFREMSLMRQRFAKTQKLPSGPQLLPIKKKILEGLIDQELLYQESQKQGIKVDEALINEQLNVLKKKFPNDAEFKKELSKLNLSGAALKIQIKRGIAIQKFVDKQFVQKNNISDNEIKDYYDSHPDFFKQPEQVRARHILIKVNSQSDESQKSEAHKKLEKIKKKLQKGENFEDLAKEFSQCPSSTKGGDLGYFRREQMVKPFSATAFALKAGEVSDIVETTFGYHLIKAIDRKPENITGYGDAKDQIERYLSQEKVKKEVGLYLEQLKEKAKVERFLPPALS